MLKTSLSYVNLTVLLKCVLYKDCKMVKPVYKIELKCKHFKYNIYLSVKS